MTHECSVDDFCCKCWRGFCLPLFSLLDGASCFSRILSPFVFHCVDFFFVCWMASFLPQGFASPCLPVSLHNFSLFHGVAAFPRPCPSACLRPACLPACLPARIGCPPSRRLVPPCVPAHFPVFLAGYFGTCLPTPLPAACLPACLPFVSSPIFFPHLLSQPVCQFVFLLVSFVWMVCPPSRRFASLVSRPFPWFVPQLVSQLASWTPSLSCYGSRCLFPSLSPCFSPSLRVSFPT